MADLGDMKIRIGADITDVAAKIDQLKVANVQLREETGALSTAYKKNANELRDLGVIQRSATGLTDAQAARMGFLREQQQKLSFAIVDNKEVLKQSVSVVNSYDKSLVSTGGTVTKLYGGLRTLANIIPGIGIGGLVALIAGPLIEAFEDWFTSVNKVSDATKLLQANQANLNDILKDANKDAGKQTADLKILYDTATNVNLSMKDRLAAVKGLQTEFPDFFKNLKTEAILNGNAKVAYDDATNSILAQARAKAVLSKIEELTAKQLDNDIERQKVLNATSKEINKAQAQQGTGSQIIGGLGVTAQSQGLTKSQVQDIIKNRRDLRLGVLDENAKLLQGQIDFLTKFASLPSLAKAVEKEIKPPPKGKKGDDPFTVELQDLQDNYNDALALVKGATDLELQVTKDFLEKKKALLEKYGKYEGENNLKIAENNNKIYLAELKFRAEQIIPSTLPSITDLTKETKQKIDNAPTLHLTPELQAQYDLLVKQQKILDDTAKTVSDVLSPAFDALFTSILDGSGKAFQAFGDALLKTIEQLAATIAKAAALAAIFAFIFPGSTLGSKGFSAIFNKLLGFAEGGHVKGYASGGPIQGPGTSTSDSILARLSKGEYIMQASAVSQWGVPFLDMINNGKGFSNFNGLPKFASGGFVSPNLSNISGGVREVPYLLETSLRGQDLRLVLKRADDSYRRNS